MKKILVGVLLLALLIPTVAFAGNGVNAAEVFKSIVGSDPVPGTRIKDQAEAAGKGEEFFQAMQAEREKNYQGLADEKILTQEEAEFLIQKMKQNSYGDQQMMSQIRQKLRDANLSGQGNGPMGRTMRQNDCDGDCPQDGTVGPGPFGSGTGDCAGDGPMGQMGGRMGRGR